MKLLAGHTEIARSAGYVRPAENTGLVGLAGSIGSADPADISRFSGSSWTLLELLVLLDLGLSTRATASAKISRLSDST